MEKINPKCVVNEEDSPKKNETYSAKVHLHKLVNRTPEERKTKDSVWSEIEKSIKNLLPLNIKTFKDYYASSLNSLISSNVYFSRIKKIFLEFIDISSDHAKSGKHWTNWFKHPYMFIFVVNCVSMEKYKKYVKLVLIDLIRYCARKDYQYIIIYSKREKKKRTSIFSVSIFEKLKTDFSKENITKIENSKKTIRAQYSKLVLTICEKVLLEFVKRCTKFEDKIVEVKKEKKYNLFKFFILQEGFAFIFEQFGLFIEAISKYNELKQLFTLKKIDFKQFHESNFVISKIISPDQKRYRTMIYDSDVAEFDFLTYIFARKINLFFFMENLEEVSKTSIEFITEIAGKMRRKMDIGKGFKVNITNDQKQIYIHSWCYCIARVVIEKSQTIVTKFKKLEKIRSLFRALSDLYVIARTELETLGMIFDLNVSFKETENVTGKKSQVDVDDSMIIYSSNYHFSDRLKEALFNEVEFKKLYIELLYTTRNSYKSGGRFRLFQRVNKELSDIRMDQNLYNEANILLQFPKISNYYREQGWFSLAVDIDLRNAKCFEKMNDTEKFLESCVTVFLYHYLVKGKEKNDLFLLWEKVKKAKVQNFVFSLNDLLNQSISFENKFSKVFESFYFDPEENLKIFSSNSINFVLNFSNFLPKFLEIKKVRFTFRDFEGEKTSPRIFVNSDKILKSEDGNSVQIKFFWNFLKIGVYYLEIIEFFLLDNFVIKFKPSSFLKRIQSNANHNMKEKRGIKLLHTFLVVNIQPSFANVKLHLKNEHQKFFNKEKEKIEVMLSPNGDYIEKGTLKISLPGNKDIIFLKDEFDNKLGKIDKGEDYDDEKKMCILFEENKGEDDVELNIPVMCRNFIDGIYDINCLFSYTKNTEEKFSVLKNFSVEFFQPFKIFYQTHTPDADENVKFLQIRTKSISKFVLNIKKVELYLKDYKIVENFKSDQQIVLEKEETCGYVFKIEKSATSVQPDKDYKEGKSVFRIYYGLSEEKEINRIRMQEFEVNLIDDENFSKKFEIKVKIPPKIDFGTFVPISFTIFRKFSIEEKLTILYRLKYNNQNWMTNGFVENYLDFESNEIDSISVNFNVMCLKYGKVKLPDIDIISKSFKSTEIKVKKSPEYVWSLPQQKSSINGYLKVRETSSSLSFGKTSRTSFLEDHNDILSPKEKKNIFESEIKRKDSSLRGMSRRDPYFIVSKRDQVIPEGIVEKKKVVIPSTKNFHVVNLGKTETNNGNGKEKNGKK